MVGSGVKVVLIDAVLLVFGFVIQQDIQWRSAYASSVLGYAQSVSYSVLTKFFTMTGRGSSLESPPTLDWVQVLAYALLLVNAWFVYRSLKPRRSTSLPSE